MEMMFGVENILRHFRIKSLNKKEKIRVSLEPIIRPKERIIVKLIKDRNPSFFVVCMWIEIKLNLQLIMLMFSKAIYIYIIISFCLFLSFR